MQHNTNNLTELIRTFKFISLYGYTHSATKILKLYAKAKIETVPVALLVYNFFKTKIKRKIFYFK